MYYTYLFCKWWFWVSQYMYKQTDTLKFIVCLHILSSNGRKTL